MYHQHQVQPLPYPADGFTQPFMQVQPGNAPVNPQLQFVPQPLVQYVPLIITEAMDALQAKAHINHLRVFTFNQMADNGWHNVEFAGFVQALIELIDFKLATGAMRDPVQCIRAMAVTYAEIQTGLNVGRYPALLQGMDQGMAAAVQEVQRQAQMTGQEIRMYQQRLSQTMQQPQPYGGGGYGGGPAYGGGQPGSFVTGGGRGHGGVIDMRRQQMQSAGVGGSTGVFNNSHRADPAAAYDTGEPASGGDRWNRGRKQQHSENVQQGRPAPLGSTGNVAAGPAPFTNSPWAAVKQVQGSQSVRMPTGDAQPVQPQARNLPTGVRLDPYEVKWVPSVKAPANVVFDPLSTVLCYEINPEGKFLQPAVYKKDEEQMDINQHVTTPSFLATQPVGIDDLDTRARQFEMDKSLQEDKELLGDPPEKLLHVTYQDDPVQVDVSIENMWLRNETSLALMKKFKAKVNLHRTIAVSLVPLVTRTNPRSMITAIAKSPSFEAAAKVMKRYLAEDDENSADTRKILTFVNNRLTQRLNDFVRKGMALPAGTIDSFMEDAPGLPAWMEKKWSSAFSSVLVENQAAILVNALEVTDEDFAAVQNTNLFPEDKLEEVSKLLTVTYFCDYTTLTSVDLFSNELRFDFPPNNTVSCGVFSSKTPLLHAIADNTLTHARNFDNVFYRHLVRTADGATLEILPSATTQNFIMVCPENL